MDDEWLAVDVFRLEMAAVLSPAEQKKREGKKDKKMFFITLFVFFWKNIINKHLLSKLTAVSSSSWVPHAFELICIAWSPRKLLSEDGNPPAWLTQN